MPAGLIYVIFLGFTYVLVVLISFILWKRQKEITINLKILSGFQI